MYLPPPRYNEHTKVYRKKTLIFDLDETMIHCLDEKEHEQGIKADVVINVPIDDPDSSDYYVGAEVNIRPNL